MSKPIVYIDGREGTTGLQIYDRLSAREDLELLLIKEEKRKDPEERARLIQFLKENDILAVFHYVPLHSAPAGLKFGRFHGQARFTTKESERLLRLPMFYQLTSEQTAYIAGKVKEFYGYQK